MSEYAERKPWDLEPHYIKHVNAMTGEGLHSKAAIAAELAYRDQRIEELEKQLSERDAALAQCVEALQKASYALFQIKRMVPEAIKEHAIKACDSACEVLNNLPTSAQATAKVLAAARETQEKYNELLYGVSIKHQNETRHETALRYIRQAEYPKSDGSCESPREEQEGK